MEPNEREQEIATVLWFTLTKTSSHTASECKNYIATSLAAYRKELLEGSE